MKNNKKMVMKLLCKGLLAIVIIVLLALLISHFFSLSLTKSFLYLGIACFVLGILSLTGNSTMNNANATHMQLNHLNYKSSEKMAQDFLKQRDGSFDFLLFMAIIGAISIGISYLI